MKNLLILLSVVLLASCSKPLEYKCSTLHFDGQNREIVNTWYSQFESEQEMKEYIDNINSNRVNKYISYCERIY